MPTWGPTNVTRDVQETINDSTLEDSQFDSFNRFGPTVSPRNDYNIGFRWTNVTIPQSASIISASFTFEVLPASPFGTPSGSIRGELTGSAEDFEQSLRRPNQLTGSAATVAMTPSTGHATGNNVFEVTAIIQEIVNRFDWQSGNALILNMFNEVVYDGGDDTSWVSNENYDSGPTPATLTIDYVFGVEANPLYEITNTSIPVIRYSPHI